MCGIVGYIGERDAISVLLKGLKKLEYRGYDSAGIAVIQEGKLDVVKAKGRLAKLEERLRGRSAPKTLGIGPTRWATWRTFGCQRPSPYQYRGRSCRGA